MLDLKTLKTIDKLEDDISSNPDLYNQDDVNLALLWNSKEQRCEYSVTCINKIQQSILYINTVTKEARLSIMPKSGVPSIFKAYDLNEVPIETLSLIFKSILI